MEKRINKTTFGIIGYGRFGKLWAKHLAKFGNVLVYDRKSVTIPQSRIKSASLAEVIDVDILFLAVPISKLENCCRQIKPLLKSKTLVADVSSVKVFPAKMLRQYLPKKQSLVGTHPMFGPDSVGEAKDFSGFKIAVTPIRIKPGELEGFVSILKKLGPMVFLTTTENHDRQMANSQGLIHFIGRGLQNLQLKPQEIATPDYKSLLHLKDMVVNDTWQLFLDMQRYNKFVKPIRRKFLLNLSKAEAAIKQETTGMANIRHQIDRLDHMLIAGIAQRINLAKNMGDFKKKRGIKVMDNKREKEVEAKHVKLSKHYGLSSKHIADIFSKVINYSRKVQS